MVASTLDGIPPLALAGIAWAASAVVLVVVATAVERPDWADAVRRSPRLVLLGIVGMGACSALSYTAVTLTSPLNAAVLNCLCPVVMLAIAGLGRKTSITGRTGAALGVALCGAAIAVTDGDPARVLRLELGIGDLAMLGAVVVWSAYAVLVGRETGPAPLTSTAIQATAAALALFVPAALVGIRVPADPLGWAAVGYVALVPTALGYLLWTAGARRIPATTTALVLPLSIVFTALLGLPLGRPVAPAQLLGGALIVVALLGATLTRRGRGWSGSRR